MAITVNWVTKVISVPKADMTLIQSSPTEIRELNLNTFRRTLKDLEDDVEGMPYLDTHRHNTEVDVGGLTLARVVEIINGYTVTFEDGQYAVNLTGANSNVGDVVNVNQVSVRSFNSAGLISSPDIEYASFNGGVTLDVNSSFSGTLFPVGTERAKVNNLADALLIAQYRGFNTIYLDSDLTINSGSDLDGFYLVGKSHVHIQLIINSVADVVGLTIDNVHLLNSTLDGDVNIHDCIVEDVDYVNGHIHDCGLTGTITLGGNRHSVMEGCYAIDISQPPTIDMGMTGNSLAMPNYIGKIYVRNFNDASNEIGIGLGAGMVEVMSTVTAGSVSVTGVGLVVDNSTGSAVVNTAALIDATTINGMEIVTDKLATMLQDAPTPGNSQYTEEALELSGSSFFSGTGSVIVDWNYDGGDYRYLDGVGSGIQDATVFAYLKSDYDNNRREAQFVQAQTWTNVHGEWRGPMNLDAGTYTLYYFKRGQYGPDTQDVVVTV